MNTSYYVPESANDECIGSAELKQRLAENREKRGIRQQERSRKRFWSRVEEFTYLLNHSLEVVTAEQIVENFCSDADSSTEEESRALQYTAEATVGAYFPAPAFKEAIFTWESGQVMTSEAAEHISRTLLKRSPKKFYPTTFYTAKRNWFRKLLTRKVVDKGGEDVVWRHWISELFFRQFWPETGPYSWRYLPRYEPKEIYDVRTHINNHCVAIKVGRIWDPEDVLRFHRSMVAKNMPYQIW